MVIWDNYSGLPVLQGWRADNVVSHYKMVIWDNYLGLPVLQGWRADNAVCHFKMVIWEKLLRPTCVTRLESK